MINNYYNFVIKIYNKNMGIIELDGMEFFAFHGCFKEERIIGNRFLVNVSLNVDTKLAEETDDLTNTVNYQTIFKIVKKEMSVPSKLLEHLSRRIIDKISEQYPLVKEITVKVSKVHPSLGGKIDHVSVTLKK